MIVSTKSSISGCMLIIRSPHQVGWRGWRCSYRGEGEGSESLIQLIFSWQVATFCVCSNDYSWKRRSEENKCKSRNIYMYVRWGVDGQLKQAQGLNSSPVRNHKSNASYEYWYVCRRTHRSGGLIFKLTRLLFLHQTKLFQRLNLTKVRPNHSVGYADVLVPKLPFNLCKSDTQLLRRHWDNFQLSL